MREQIISLFIDFDDWQVTPASTYKYKQAVYEGLYPTE